MVLFYAMVGGSFLPVSYIVLSKLEVKETPKLYIVQSQKDISSTCHERRIEKNSPHIFHTIDDAMGYIHQKVEEHITRMHEVEANLRDRENRLTASYEAYKKEKEANNATPD